MKQETETILEDARWHCLETANKLDNQGQWNEAEGDAIELVKEIITKCDKLQGIQSAIPDAVKRAMYNELYAASIWLARDLPRPSITVEPDLQLISLPLSQTIRRDTIS